MKNFNIKSKKGFTLIELLVVIGILAVLAAIAIPSIAGLIDRANVSADNTNANEMTNAMERFVSEYELFRQDIASGTFDVNNMDAAQGRVYNVTGADSIEDIRALESEAGFNGIRIDLDNKYAQNYATAKAVIENYMKTSSSTFEPKQSDMTYWYNTVTGYTIVAEKDIDTATLESLLPQKIQYGTSQAASMTEWIDLSSNIEIPDIISGKCSYKTGVRNGENIEGITFHFSIPNPKYHNIDFSKIYFLRGFPENGTLSINNYYKIFNFQECLQKGSIADNSNTTEDDINFEFFLYTITGSRHPDTKTQFRIVYEYETNGQTKYIYTPTLVISYNDIK